MARIRARDRRTAAANAEVRYGPQKSALALLLGEAQDEYRQDKRAAVGAARSTIKLARKARAPLRAVYDEALTRADTAKADVQQAFGDIGAAADPFEAATARESTLNRQQIADAAARANKELSDRAHEAAIGRQYAVGAARQRYAEKRSQIDRQASELLGQQGAFESAQLGDLLNTRENRAANRRTQLDVIREADRVKEEGLSGEALKDKAKGGFKPASRDDLRAFKTDYARALSQAKKLQAGGGWTREEMEAALTEGTPNVAERGKPGDEDYREPSRGVQSVDDQLAIAAALDQVFSSGVSKANFKAMREAGYRVAQIPGLSNPRQARRTRRKREQANALAQERAYQSPRY